VIEKLIENWLDNASERSYQSVFVQMLAADGYTVLHSTRHCLLEFGKDILAIAPDGVGCAFQLKGNPGGRMTIGMFRKDIQPQLVQLMGQSPAFPGFPVGKHRAYLVSNGQYEEEVQTAVRDMNAAPYPAQAELWSRGYLFKLCKRHGASLWPSELKDNRALLELYLANPRDQLPIGTLAAMLESVLRLTPGTLTFGRAELERAASSAAWLTGICTATFAEAENHSATALGWTLCCVMLIGAAEKHARGDISSVRTSLPLAKNSMLDSMAALWEEVRGRKYLVEGNALTDPEVYGWRVAVLYGFLASLAIADKELSLLSIVSREALHEWLKTGGHRAQLWGEAAVANLLPWLLWLRRQNATMLSDAEILTIATAVIKLNQPKSKDALPTPHYNFETVLRQQLNLHGMKSPDALEQETFAGSAFTAEALMHLLVRIKMKQQCKSLWPDFTRLGHRRLSFDEPWHYCLLRAQTGVDETRLYPSTYEWTQLEKDALQETQPSSVPNELRTCPWLLSMWWQVAPHRLDSEAMRVFANAMLPGCSE
jgi:hypothetical protein